MDGFYDGDGQGGQEGNVWKIRFMPDEIGNRSGYGGDWHTISFDKPVILKGNETYNYTIRTGSYPRIIHAHTANVTGGIITDAMVNAGSGWDTKPPIVCFRLQNDIVIL